MASICQARHGIVELDFGGEEKTGLLRGQGPEELRTHSGTPHFTSKAVSSIITLMWMRLANFDVETGVFFAGQDATHILLKCMNPNQTSG